MSIVIDVRSSNALIRRIGAGKIAVNATTAREAFKQTDLLHAGFYSDVVCGKTMRDSLQVAIKVTDNSYRIIELDTPIPDGSEISFTEQMVGG
jgi:hypothetical protein